MKLLQLQENRTGGPKSLEEGELLTYSMEQSPS